MYVYLSLTELRTLRLALTRLHRNQSAATLERRLANLVNGVTTSTKVHR